MNYSANATKMNRGFMKNMKICSFLYIPLFRLSTVFGCIILLNIFIFIKNSFCLSYSGSPIIFIPYQYEFILFEGILDLMYNTDLYHRG